MIKKFRTSSDVSVEGSLTMEGRDLYFKPGHLFSIVFYLIVGYQ